MYYPAVHHNPNKRACVTFRTRGEYKRITLASKDRKDALATVKARYPDATQISIVFFIKEEENNA